jgi:UDP-N-acetylglucosamine 4,6-dehydratase
MRDRNNYDVNGLKERGHPVEQGFEYNSGTNPRFLSVEEIRAFNHFSGIA